MSNDTPTPGSGHEPDRPWPTPDTGSQPYGAPAPSGYEVPSSTNPTPGTGADAEPTQAFPQPGYTAPSGYPAAPGYGTPDAGATPGYPSAGYPSGGYAPGQPDPAAAGAGYPAAGPAYAQGGYATGQYPAPPAPANRSTDGVSIAALVTGILGLAIVPLILGILGLRRTKQNGTQGRGMSIAGIILGSLAIVGWTVAVILIFAVTSAYDSRMDELRADCTAGEMRACDSLYRESPRGSDDEEFGDTCGGRTDGTMWCTSIDPTKHAYGDDADLDVLWDACDGGDDQACDTLYFDAPQYSEYREFGDTCGGRDSGGSLCYTEEPTRSGDADTYGDDAELDALWDACEAGDNQACDDLYFGSPFGSEYEEFGDTCGGRDTSGAYCNSSSRSDDRPQAYGDDATLDALWDACEAGSGSACDDLYWDSPIGSEYESFGRSCGNRDEVGSCESKIGA